MELNNPKVLLIGLFTILVMALPRFNGNKWLVQTEPYDAKYFESYVSYFRGEKPLAPIRPASNWRFLTPVLASALPFKPNTSLNLINLFYLFGAVFFLNQILVLRKVQLMQRLKAILIFALLR